MPKMGPGKGKSRGMFRTATAAFNSLSAAPSGYALSQEFVSMAFDSNAFEGDAKIGSPTHNPVNPWG